MEPKPIDLRAPSLAGFPDSKGACSPSGLLISVRNATEAADALAGGADVIDVKEPNQGALGRASAERVAQAVAQIAGGVPVTAAAGELADLATDDLVAWAEASRAALVKVGLSKIAKRRDWRSDLARLAELLAPTISMALVSYADWRQAEAPSPAEILQASERLGTEWIVLDTFDKRSGSLFDYWIPEEVRRFISSCQNSGRRIVLAGGLQDHGLSLAARMGADLIGVRGAVCVGGRGNALSRDAVRRVAIQVHGEALATRRQTG